MFHCLCVIHQPTLLHRRGHTNSLQDELHQYLISFVLLNIEKSAPVQKKHFLTYKSRSSSFVWTISCTDCQTRCWVNYSYNRSNSFTHSIQPQTAPLLTTEGVRQLQPSVVKLNPISVGFPKPEFRRPWLCKKVSLLKCSQIQPVKLINSPQYHHSSSTMRPGSQLHNVPGWWVFSLYVKHFSG